jgi:hypothetical protein
MRKTESRASRVYDQHHGIDVLESGWTRVVEAIAMQAETRRLQPIICKRTRTCSGGWLGPCWKPIEDQSDRARAFFCSRNIGRDSGGAQAKGVKLDSLVDYPNAIATLSIALGRGASKFDPTGPAGKCPRKQRFEERTSAGDRPRQARESDGAKARATARRPFQPHHGGGKSKTIAGEMEERLFTEGCDGVTVIFPYLPIRTGLTMRRRKHNAKRSRRSVAAPW